MKDIPRVVVDSTHHVAPWLTVVMPVYNGSRYLAQALDSVAAQTERDFEIVAVDNGSDDLTLTILRAYATRLPMRVVTQPHAESWLRGTNEALLLSRGAFVSILHDDDCWREDRLAVLKSLASAHPSADMVFSSVTFVDESGTPLGRWRAPLKEGIHRPRAVNEPLLVQNFIAVVAPIVRRDALLKAGGLNEALWYSADWDCWLRVSRDGAVVYHAAQLASYRIHARSQTTTRSRKRGSLRQQLLAAYEPNAREWLSENPHRHAIDRVARFSIEANVALAEFAQGQWSAPLRLSVPFVALGPFGWRRYLRDSRIVERLRARLVARRRANSHNERARS